MHYPFYVLGSIVFGFFKISIFGMRVGYSVLKRFCCIYILNLLVFTAPGVDFSLVLCGIFDI